MPEPNYKKIQLQIADCIHNGDQSKDCSLMIKGKADAVRVANYLRQQKYIVSTIDYGESVKVVVHRI